MKNSCNFFVMHAHKEFVVWPILSVSWFVLYLILFAASFYTLEAFPSTNEAHCYFWNLQFYSCLTMTGSFFSRLASCWLGTSNHIPSGSLKTRSKSRVSCLFKNKDTQIGLIFLAYTAHCSIRLHAAGVVVWTSQRTSPCYVYFAGPLGTWNNILSA